MARAAANTKLKEALASHDWRAIREAVEAGANPDTKCGRTGHHALSIACWYLRTDVVGALLARGANPNIARGWPLLETVTTTNGGDARAVLRQLLDHGATIDIRYPHRRGASALAIALETGHPQLAEMLVKAGADLALADDDGATPLKIARAEGWTRLVELMTGVVTNRKTGVLAIDPFIEATYGFEVAKGKTPHVSGVPDWRRVFRGKHYPGCGNPPVHLLTIDLARIPELPEKLRELGRLHVVGHACQCDEQDCYEFAIGRDGRLASLDDEESASCEPGDHRPSKRATSIRLVRRPADSTRAIRIGGLPHWQQSPVWPSCPRCDEKSFFVACLYQYELPPSAPGPGNTLDVFVCADCRTQTVIRQST